MKDFSIPQDAAQLQTSEPGRGSQHDGYVSNVPTTPAILLIPGVTGDISAENVEVSVVVNVADLVEMCKIGSGIYSIGDPTLLSCLLDYPTLFTANLTMVDGFPAAVYTADFRDLTYKLPSVSYGQLMLDVATSRRATAALQNDLRSTPEGRDRATTRKSGYKREFTKFDGTDAPAAHTDDFDEADAA